MARKKPSGKKSTTQDAAWQRVKAAATPLQKRNLMTYASIDASTDASIDRPSNKPTNKLRQAKAKAAPQTSKMPTANTPTANIPKARINGPGKAKPTQQKSTHQKSTKPPQARIDMRSRRRLQRGALPIDATLDLHGLTLAEAERVLAGFIARQGARGSVWLLVITGKGTRGEGKLRAALPGWMATPAIAHWVVEHGEAAIAHGGSGAFYLRLRKAKS